VFNTRALGEVTGTTRLKVRIENPAASPLDESNGKALSAKHAYQEELKNLTHFSFEVVGESPKAKVRLGSKHTLGSYHETHKGTCLKPLGSQPESGQKSRVGTRVPARDVSITRAYVQA